MDTPLTGLIGRLRVRGMRQEELAVHLHTLEDARCVADALGQGDASVTPSKICAMGRAGFDPRRA
jgi:hypothetical protein